MNPKYLYLNFDFTAAGQSITKEIEMPADYRKIEKTTFHCPNQYPVSNTIESAQFGNDSGILQSGIFVGAFQENFSGVSPMSLPELKFESEKQKIKFTLKDKNSFTIVGAYQIQIILKVVA